VECGNTFQKIKFIRFAFRSKTNFEIECRKKITGFSVCLFSFILLKICDTFKECSVGRKVALSTIKTIKKWKSIAENWKVVSWINEVKKCWVSWILSNKNKLKNGGATSFLYFVCDVTHFNFCFFLDRKTGKKGFNKLICLLQMVVRSGKIILTGKYLFPLLKKMRGKKSLQVMCFSCMCDGQVIDMW
jgi:hypothetical protein